MHCARTHVRLDEVLDTIRDNLRREQKTVMELNCALPFIICRRLKGIVWGCKCRAGYRFDCAHFCLGVCHVCVYVQPHLLFPACQDGCDT